MEWARPNHGLRTGGPEHLGDESVEVALVEREIVDVPFARVLQLPLGAALAAPVERRDRKAAVEQFADRLEIFLDELGAAAENRHRAAHARGGVQRAARSCTPSTARKG